MKSRLMYITKLLFNMTIGQCKKKRKFREEPKKMKISNTFPTHNKLIAALITENIFVV